MISTTLILTQLTKRAILAGHSLIKRTTASTFRTTTHITLLERVRRGVQGTPSDCTYKTIVALSCCCFATTDPEMQLQETGRISICFPSARNNAYCRLMLSANVAPMAQEDWRSHSESNRDSRLRSATSLSIERQDLDFFSLPCSNRVAVSTNNFAFSNFFFDDSPTSIHQ